MLEEKYKSPWKVIQISGQPTVGQLVAAAGGSAVTVGFALGSGTMAGLASLAGVTAVCLPWGAAAVAASRLMLTSAGRVMGVVAKGAINGLKVPGASKPPTFRAQWSGNVPGGSLAGLLRPQDVAAPPGITYGGIRPSGAAWITVTNGLSTTASMSTTGTADDYALIDGRRAAGVQTGNFQVVNDFIPSVRPGGSIIVELHNPTGGFAGVNLTFTFTALSPTLPDDPRAIAFENAVRAIPLLDAAAVAIYGNTVPWWPVGETMARSGQWMRRRSWSDADRRIRFEAGAGTAAEVAVLRDSVNAVPIPLRSEDFGAAEFLSQDWEAYAVPDPHALIDVTDFQFQSSIGGGAGFFFAVVPAGDLLEGGGGGGGSVPAPPAVGDFVLMSRAGMVQWVIGKEFTCQD